MGGDTVIITFYCAFDGGNHWHEWIIFKAIRTPVSPFFNKEQTGSTKSQTRIRLVPWVFEVETKKQWATQSC
jgi:hypothetical protein